MRQMSSLRVVSAASRPDDGEPGSMRMPESGGGAFLASLDEGHRMNQLDDSDLKERRRDTERGTRDVFPVFLLGRRIAR